MNTVTRCDIESTTARMRRYSVAGSVALALGLWLPLAAFAEDETAIGEVLVTAQRRMQKSIMDVRSL